MPSRFHLRHYAALTLMVLLSVPTFARCHAQDNPPADPETAAIARLKAIAVAEETYKLEVLGYNKYATLSELKWAGLMDWPSNTNWIKDGYEYMDITPTPGIDYWGIKARPIDGTPGRNLVVTMDYHIRGKAGVNVTLPPDLETALNNEFWPVLETVGDIDGSGSTDVSDTVTALRSIVGIVQLTEEQSRRADITQDSQVDVQDAITILKMALTAPPHLGSERAASARLQAISYAQGKFQYNNLGRDGKYATLAQLRNVGLVVWPDNSDFEEDGYRFGDVAAPDADSWAVYAVPLEGTVGRTLVMTTYGHVRGNYSNVPPSELPILYDSSVWPVIYE